MQSVSQAEEYGSDADDMGIYAQQQQAQVNLVLQLPWYGICSPNSRLSNKAKGKCNLFPTQKKLLLLGYGICNPNCWFYNKSTGKWISFLTRFEPQCYNLFYFPFCFAVLLRGMGIWGVRTQWDYLSRKHCCDVSSIPWCGRQPRVVVGW